MRKKNIKTTAEITWCKGCGNFGILNAFSKTIQKLEEKGIKLKELAMTSGIGCHGKISDYVNINSLYSIHGRSMATAEGMKIANPELKIIDFAGDGDAYGEGLGHLIFAAKRNIDITVVVHDNGAYALTTGQFSPTSNKGFKGPSTPEGNIEEPINPLALLLEVGATFVARGYAAEVDHLSNLIAEGVRHKGFSIIDVLQPSVVFHNTYKEYNELTEIIGETPPKFEDALRLAKEKGDRIPIGIFYKIEKPEFTEELYKDWNPINKKLNARQRRARINDFLSQQKEKKDKLL